MQNRSRTRRSENEKRSMMTRTRYKNSRLLTKDENKILLNCRKARVPDSEGIVAVAADFRREFN